MFASIEQLQELVKSYYIALAYDSGKASSLLTDINRLRMDIAVDAEMRDIFWLQQNIPANASGFNQTFWISKNDIAYTLNRAVTNFSFNDSVKISTTNQGNKQRLITREFIAWQQLFSSFQTTIAGQIDVFDFPQELKFAENEPLELGVQGNTQDSKVIFHGCTLKDSISDVSLNDLQSEIDSYLPQPQLVPLLFIFSANAAGTLAKNLSGAVDILSQKNDRSVILTHVSIDNDAMDLTITDEGRNQILCENVDSNGIAANVSNPVTTYYRLPYPHLLRRGDRLKARIASQGTATINFVSHLTFYGYSM